MTILVFEDLECSACRYFVLTSLPAIRAAYPKDVSVIIRHWPLIGIHRFAYPAARAAECAAQQGRFEEFHNLVYLKQDSLGLKTFSSYAHKSGLPDIAAFEACASQTLPVPAVEADTKAVKGVGGWGTPTVIINGTMLGGENDSAAMAKIVVAKLHQTSAR